MLVLLRHGTVVALQVKQMFDGRCARGIIINRSDDSIMKRRTIVQLNIFLVFVPMLLGGLIYIFYRPLNLKMFSWFTSLKLLDSILQIRELIYKNSINLPKWIVYSLPNALWVFSGIITFQFIWQENITQLVFWVSLFSFISVMFELLQLGNIIPGNFAICDIVLIIMSIILANIYHFWLLKQEDI